MELEPHRIRRLLGKAIAWIGTIAFCAIIVAEIFFRLPPEGTITLRAFSLLTVIAGLFIEARRWGAKKRSGVLPRPMLFGLLMFAALLLVGVLLVPGF